MHTARERFARAQELARTPGSVVLARFGQQREAQRAAKIAQPARASKRLFAGAKLGRLTDSWRATLTAINDDLRGDVTRLIARARELEANNDYVARFLNMVERHVVGPKGFTFKSLAENAPGKPDELARNAIEAAFADWSRPGICDVTGQLSFHDICTLNARGQARDGEILMREVLGAAAGNKYGYALEMLDVAQLATWLNRSPSERENGIAMGIERSRAGRPIAYWFTEGEDLSTRKATRVLADTMIHRFRVVRAHQARGITGLHAAMLTLHYVGEFSVSALLNAKAGADRLGFFVSPDGQPPNIGADGLLAPLGDDEEPGEHIASSAPGAYETLPAGYDFRQVTNPYPNDVFAPFTKAQTQRAAAGLDLSYPALANDYEAVNFSSIRAAVLEDRDKWRLLQNWHIGIASRIFDRWLEMALANRAIIMQGGSALPLSKIDKFRPHAFKGRGWSWVDPYKDAQADDLRLEQRLTSRTRLAAEAGIDLEDLFAEMQAEQALAARYGIDLTRQPTLYAQAAPAPDPQE
jgi:lambda family phage portal protein